MTRPSLHKSSSGDSAEEQEEEELEETHHDAGDDNEAYRNNMQYYEDDDMTIMVRRILCFRCLLLRIFSSSFGLTSSLFDFRRRILAMKRHCVEIIP